MRLFINALSAKKGGGQTYVINLLGNFKPKPDDQVFIIHSPSLKLASYPWLIPLRTVFPTENPFLRPFWEFFILPFILFFKKIDLLFCPGGVVSTKILPFHQCKVVTMFRNMAPYEPMLYEVLKGKDLLRINILRKTFLKSMKQADGVIFISKFAEKFIKEKQKVKIKKDVVISHGITKGKNGENKLKDLLPPKYFLYVSIFDYYKHQKEVIQSFIKFKSISNDNSYKLLLVGSFDTKYGEEVLKEFSRQKLEEEGIILLGNRSSSELVEIYQNSTIQIFASSCENCPNILLEMLSYGKPMLVSNIDPMPEFGGSAPIYFDPKKVDELMQKMQEIAFNETKQISLSNESLIQSKNYDWEKTARETQKFLYELLNQ